MAQLNVMLRDASEQDLGRRIQGRPAAIADQLAQERALLHALPAAGAFDSTEIASVRVDSKALVTVRQNRYSRSKPRMSGSGWVPRRRSASQLPRH